MLEAFKKIMPLLPLASMVSNDELQEKWALLMESTATERRQVRHRSGRRFPN